jgi:hypothetical protein
MGERASYGSDKRPAGAFSFRERVMERETLRKWFVYASVISGIVAAYLMYRRGEPLGTIAAKAIGNPVGSLISEVSDGVLVR